MNWKKSIGMIGDQPIYNTKDTIKLGSIKALELLCEGADFSGCADSRSKNSMGVMFR